MALFAGALLLLAAGCVHQQTTAAKGWGIDACLTAHVDAPTRLAYFPRLQESGVGWLRERQSELSMAELRAAGYRVVGFTYLNGLAAPQAGNQLPEDLRAVFAAATAAQMKDGNSIGAWEMVGEPDVGYCTDLPDRVAAYQKALYLGLKAGARAAEATGQALGAGINPQVSGFRPQDSQNAPLVLMGALGLPPGPWLERAAANGLLDYTDAYNFHFYLHEKDFAGVIKAHRAVAASWGHRGLPLWITECGTNTIDPDDFLNPERRRMQAEFTVATAQQALATRDVAVFMPFILVHKGDPYAMTLSATEPLPAWDAYAKFTRENPWPDRPVAREPHEVNPVVVQWLPDNRTTVAHKVSGTYRFIDGKPIRGEIRIYNFSAKGVHGRLLEAEASRSSNHLRMAAREGALTDLGEIVVPAMGMQVVPVTFTPATDGYFREDWGAVFEDQDGRHSPVRFGLEKWPESADFTAEPLRLESIPENRLQSFFRRKHLVTAQAGAWTGLNGLYLKEDTAGVSGWVQAVENDPLFPVMAIAAVRGLPAEGFIRLSLERPMGRGHMVRVDLIDSKGRRFTIWENFGVSYFRSSSEVWLNLADFNIISWGNTKNYRHFDPREVRAIQLQFYQDKPGNPMRVQLSLMQSIAGRYRRSVAEVETGSGHR